MNNQSKIKHLWSVISAGSSIDIHSNSLSLFNILEDISFDVELSPAGVKEKEEKGWIFAPLNFEVITRLFSPQAIEVVGVLSISFVDPLGKTIGQTLNQDVFVKKENLNMRMKTGIQGMPVTVSGIYNIVVEFSSGKISEIKEIPLNIKYTEKISQ